MHSCKAAALQPKQGHYLGKGSQGEGQKNNQGKRARDRASKACAEKSSLPVALLVRRQIMSPQKPGSGNCSFVCQS